MRDEFVEILILSDQNKDKIKNILCEQLLMKYKVKNISELPENYSNLLPWSLFRLIEDNSLDIYQLLFINKKFWGSSGGIIRTIDNQKIYQAGFRTISASHRNVRRGLGTTPYLNRFCISEQIKRAKLAKCSKVVISFNEHNYRLFRLVQAYHNKRKFERNDEIMENFKPTETPVMFNGVLQWLLEMNL